MVKEILKETRTAMDKAVKSLKKDMTKIRTGRASISLLDDVKVEYYGVPTPLSQVATLSVPEARMITVQPWEKNLISEIEKALFKADLGLTPSSDGVLIRLPVPALTEERRREMVKIIKRMAEDAKISVRNARRDANENLKMLEKEKEITEDDLKRSEKDVQQITDEFVNTVDSIVQNKEQEVMEI
ncbi:ribosome recycling factor [Desulfuromusa kysingii]|uniref:Ribosome-recycling factor n=1 Tax=Desulfuromusa kysingii TaxID=37625 RepID=A0A1H3Y7H0_9BACT|nr:ribosome recycling factor [Desulfuromusa kysingii]SEA07533.1 ribosome recycling factor [Desulfuromusa kysingii]